MKVFIWGSCISRNCFNYNNANGIELVGYYTRHCCASAFSEPVPLDGINLQAVSSKFKQACITRDFNKTMLHDLTNTNFDILLIDFIDERFPLYEYAQDRYVTVSTELIEAGFASKAASVIPVGEERRFELWCDAWNKFMDFAVQNGFKDKIIVNKVCLTENADVVRDTLSLDINKTDIFLKKIFLYVGNDIPKYQCINYKQSTLIGHHHNDLEKLSIADKSYESIDIILKNLEYQYRFAFGRFIDNFHEYTLNARTGGDIEFISNGNAYRAKDYFTAEFRAIQDKYDVKIAFPCDDQENGITISFRITGWNDRYRINIEWIHDSKKYCVKLKHLIDGEWHFISLSKKDLIFLMNEISDISYDKQKSSLSISLSGSFSNKAIIDMRYVCIWHENTDWQSYINLKNRNFEANDVILKKISAYVKHIIRDPDNKFDCFIKNGSLPLMQDNILWNFDECYPHMLFDNISYAWSWYSMHQIMINALQMLEKNNIAGFCSACIFADKWLDRFFSGKTTLENREWYEHSVGERCISFCFLYMLATKHNFDYRFVTRLKVAVICHARLLFSEAFYVSNQVNRFHNHGMFQDIALFFAGDIFAELPEAYFWRKIAVDRLKTQINAIYIDDNSECKIENSDCKFSVSIENSYSYHTASASLLKQIASLTSISDTSSFFLNKIKQIENWTKVQQFSPYQSPSYGDTLRRGDGKRFILPLDHQKMFFALEKSGYVVARGQHEKTSFVLLVTGSSLTITHKHCDNLSFILYFDGIEWLIDPSFYNYEAGLGKYLRSPAAHNSFYIPDAKYTTEAGHAKLSGNLQNENFSIDGEHTCYKGFIVSRSIKGSLDGLHLEFADGMEPVPDDARMRLQCGENVKAEICDGGVRLSHPESQYVLFVSCTQPAAILRGQENGGMAGTGFCKSSEIDTVEFQCAGVDKLVWKLGTVKA